tara:strand:+ start:765 stop:1079 length:315 start_codon:yes stop_codon:yes gene_type:complete
MFNTICDIFSDREKQLYIQEKQDNMLMENFEKCPLTIFKLLLLERKLNREQLKNNKISNIITLINNTKNNIQKIDEYQNRLYHVLDSPKGKLCSNLQEFINRYN